MTSISFITRYSIHFEKSLIIRCNKLFFKKEPTYKNILENNMTKNTQKNEKKLESKGMGKEVIVKGKQ